LIKPNLLLDEQGFGENRCNHKQHDETAQAPAADAKNVSRWEKDAAKFVHKPLEGANTT
jgi:hypothetical protein